MRIKMGSWFFLIMILLFVAGSVSSGPALFQVEERDGIYWAGDGWLDESEGIPVAFFTGSPEEMGIQHGLLLGDDPELLEAFQSLDPATQATGFLERMGWFFKNLYARFRFYPAFKRHTPQEYLQEMEGFIRGASGDATRNYYEIMMGNASQDLTLAGPSCSSFAAWGGGTVDGHMIVGRNLDHSGFMKLASYQYVGVYVPENGYRFVVHNYPSFIGTMSGMNEKGIVITKNYSIAVPEEVTYDGLPFILMLRHVLQYAGTLEEALEMIQETPRTVGLNLMLADAGTGEAVVVEITAHRMVVRRSQDYIYSSNMYQHPYMQQFQAPGWMASALRDARFSQLGTEHFGAIDLEVGRDFLRDKLSGPAQAGFYAGINTHVNMASMIFLPEQGEIWVGMVEEEGLAPYAADGAFLGIDVARIWETGEPQEVIGTLPSTPREGYEKYWFMVRDTQILLEEGRNEEALQLIEVVLEEYPEAAIPQLLAGRLHNRLGSYSQALFYFQQFIQQEVHPEPYNLLQAYFWSGLARDSLGDREGAARDYEKVLQVSVPDMPGGIDALQQLAQAGIEAALIVENGAIRAP